LWLSKGSGHLGSNSQIKFKKDELLEDKFPYNNTLFEA
jgi:hypothetical protein